MDNIRKKSLVTYVKKNQQGFISFDNITIYFDVSEKNKDISLKKIFFNKINMDAYRKSALKKKMNFLNEDRAISNSCLVKEEFINDITINKCSVKSLESISSTDFTLSEEIERVLKNKIKEELDKL